jgi:hypothetical protein
VLEFYSGATGLSGRFTEGFSLRRLQVVDGRRRHQLRFRRIPDGVASEADELRVAMLVSPARRLRVARKIVLRWTVRGGGSKIGGNQMGHFRYAFPLKAIDGYLQRRISFGHTFMLPQMF